MKIREVSFPGPGEVCCRESERSTELGPDEILIQTEYSLISAGTELAKLTGRQQVPYPFVPGNRAVGKVIAVGPQVRHLHVGDHVFSHTRHVSHTKPAGLCVAVPEEVPLAHAPLVGLALVAITAVRVGRPELGDRAAVIGLGVVGNLCAQLLQLSGVEVFGIDRLPGRLAAAKRCGLSQVIHAGETDVREAVMEATGGQGVEYVVESSGNPRAIDTAGAVARRQAEIILLGSPRGECQMDVTPLLNKVHLWREHGCVTLKGAHEWQCPLYATDFAKHSMARNAEILFRLMADGRLKCAELITHVLPPERAAEAYHGLQNCPDEHLGVILDWA